MVSRLLELNFYTFEGHPSIKSSNQINHAEVMKRIKQVDSKSIPTGDGYWAILKYGTQLATLVNRIGLNFDAPPVTSPVDFSVKAMM
jgi:hypothetical protein